MKHALVVEDSIIEDNVARLAGTAGGGGGIRALETSVSIIGSQIGRNMSEASGGGIAVQGGDLKIEFCTIYDNSALGNGGGIFVENGAGIPGPFLVHASIANTTIADNSSTRQGGGIHLRNFSSTISNSIISGNRVVQGGPANQISTSRRGGGIYLYGGTLNIENCHLLVNSVVASSGSSGGAIFSNGKLSLVGSQVGRNSTTGNGGGLSFGPGAEATIQDSIIAENAARGSGGGIDYQVQARGNPSDIPDLRLVIHRSTVRDNIAGGDGGGINVRHFRSTSVSDSTVSGNTAGGNGGGIAGQLVTYAGLPNAELRTLNTTVSGNLSHGNGGGIFLQSNQQALVGTFAHTTITSNTSNSDRLNGGSGGGVFVGRGIVRFDHAIVAANLDLSEIGPDVTGFIGTMVEPRFSLIGSSIGSGLNATPIGMSDVNGNLIGGATTATRIIPLLGPLADNGGPTMTHALLLGSPAINAGDLNAVAGEDGVPAHDQRGEPFTRVYGGRIDIGAVEAIPAGFLPGDFNLDSSVDAADYTLWRNTTGLIVADGTGADGNGDGKIDALDYAVWKRNFGITVEQLGAESGMQGVGAVALKAGTDAVGKRDGENALRGGAGELTSGGSEAGLRSSFATRVSGGLRKLHRESIATRQDRLLEIWVASRNAGSTKTESGEPAPRPHYDDNTAISAVDAAMELLDGQITRLAL